MTGQSQQLQNSLSLDNGQSITISNRVIAPIGEPTTDISGDDASLRVTRTGSLLANDEGNTAVQVTGKDATINNLGRIAGDFNGISSGADGLELTNRGTIASDSRAVDLSNGDGLVVNNFGRILGTDDQRNGTFYVNGVVDNAEITNRARGRIDAGFGNSGDGLSVQVGDASEDAINDQINITNRGVIFGRGQAEFDGGRLTANGSSGLRFFNGSGETEAIINGVIRNSGLISTEVNVGFLGGLVIEDGVSYQGTITNERAGRITGPRNGLYVGNANHDLTINNRNLIASGSRAVNLDGNNVTLNNSRLILGTDDQRNGTIYIDGTGDDITINNQRGGSSFGVIDAGIGNIGDGISVQVGSSSEDAINENININNRGFIFGRGQAEFDSGRLGSNGSSGLRFFNGSGEAEAIVTGVIRNSGLISAEVNVGFLGGLVVEDGVSYQGTITNERAGRINGPRNGLYIGNAEHDLTINNRGAIASGSRALNLDGDNVTVNNSGRIIGTDDQRNGTVYVDGTGDDITINNRDRGVIDAGRGNSGSGVSVQVGAANGLGEGVDDLETSVNINNQGTIQGRGNDNVPAGIRFFVGSGLDQVQVTFSGNIVNQRGGLITSEQDAGILVESGVKFDGEIINNGTIRGGNGLAINATGASGNIEVRNNGNLIGGVNLGEGDDTFRQNSNQGVNVNGLGGDDLIIAGRGSDRFTGGQGSDTFRFNLNSGTDIITDFEAIDTIDVGNIFGNVNEILGSNGAATQVGDDVNINFGGNNSLTLENFEVSNLSADNFLIS